MPTIHDLKQSRFLTKSDVTPPKLFTIKAYRLEDISQEGEAPDNQYLLFFYETEKPLVLKPVNGDLIALALGKESFDEWIGHQIVVFVDPTVTMKGKVVGGIRCRAPKTKVAPAPAAPAAPPPAPARAKPATDWSNSVPAEPADDDV